MDSKPTIAIIGASGYVGQFLTSAFISGLKSSKIKELRLLSTKKSDIIDTFVNQGATSFLVNFSHSETLVSSFSSVDIVISTLGTGPGTGESKKAILDALIKAGVKIYFPSEFGTNHYTRLKNYSHPLFQEKKDHFEEAQAKGIKTVRILCSLIMESSFGPWFGFDYTNPSNELWTLVGKGETLVATTAEKDIGQFTLEAALLAYKDPKCPDLIEFYSDIRTLKEYAKAFDKVAGRDTKLEFTHLNQALAHYKSAQEPFEYLLQILFEEGAFHHTNVEGNELLNPGESKWKLKKVEEYSEETGGRPWRDFKA